MTRHRTPVLFIHGLWLHATSWDPWLPLFGDAGYEPHAPGWPGEPPTVTLARERPDDVANRGIDEVAGHFRQFIAGLPAAPILVGHSFGGLIVEKLLGEGIGRAGIAIDPAQIQGVWVLPLAQLRAGLPALGNPFNRSRAVSLTAEEFRYGFGNSLSEQESQALFDRWTIPSPAKPLFEDAVANFNPNSAAKVDVRNQTRGPLLLISGTADHTVPDVTTQSTFEQYRHSTAITELQRFEGRGHSLTIDHGWHDVATACLAWLAAQGL